MSTDLTVSLSGSKEHPYPLEIGEHAIGSLRADLDSRRDIVLGNTKTPVVSYLVFESRGVHGEAGVLLKYPIPLP